MPNHIFALLILGVIVAGGLTVWLLTVAGPTALMVALPLFMIATVALKLLRK